MGLLQGSRFADVIARSIYESWNDSGFYTWEIFRLCRSGKISHDFDDHLCDSIRRNTRVSITSLENEKAGGSVFAIAFQLHFYRNNYIS